MQQPIYCSLCRLLNSILRLKEREILFQSLIVRMLDCGDVNALVIAPRWRIMWTQYDTITSITSYYMIYGGYFNLGKV